MAGAVYICCSPINSGSEMRKRQEAGTFTSVDSKTVVNLRPGAHCDWGDRQASRGGWRRRECSVAESDSWISPVFLAWRIIKFLSCWCSPCMNRLTSLYLPEVPSVSDSGEMRCCVRFQGNEKDLAFDSLSGALAGPGAFCPSDCPLGGVKQPEVVGRGQVLPPQRTFGLRSPKTFVTWWFC